MERLDHRHLNYEVPELAGQIPTCENIAAMIWGLLEPKITKGKLDRVRCTNRPDLFADCTAEVEAAPEPERVAVGTKESRFERDGKAGMARPLKISLTRRYRFAASHRLYSAKFSEEENRRLVWEVQRIRMGMGITTRWR